MVIAAIIVGILWMVLFFVADYISHKKGNDFDNGIVMGIILFLCFIVEVILIGNIIKDPHPTAMDVYKGKTTLEYTIKDSVKIDSTVVFKDSLIN
jgi:hypothetical protein